MTEPAAPAQRLGFEQGFELEWTRLLAALLDVATFATRADLRRSGAVSVQANADVDKVPASTETVTLLEANGYRRGASIENDSTATLYLKLGRGASSDDWSVSLNQNDYYEPPAGYRGDITGVWSSATGQARVSEFD